MYTAFYGLREKPFALVPDPRFLFLGEAHQEALAHLLYGIEQGEGFIAVTGEVGTGKTTLCRTLLERLGAETEVAFLFNPSRSGIELLQDICAEFALPFSGRSKAELGAALNDFLLEKNREHRRVLLIIDEAQNLSPGMLEQVRLLSNLETSSSKLIQILLLGQPELDRKLDSPELRQLRQRISVRWGLGPLDAKETREYVRHRIRIAAGSPREIFNEAALREIHRCTRGIPRLVNVLCDRALLAGYAAQAATVTRALVKQAASEIPDARRSGLQRLVGRRRRRPSGTTRRRRVGVGRVLTAATIGGLLLVAGWLGGSGRLDAELFGELFEGIAAFAGGAPIEAGVSVATSPRSDEIPVMEVVSPPPSVPSEVVIEVESPLHSDLDVAELDSVRDIASPDSSELQVASLMRDDLSRLTTDAEPLTELQAGRFLEAVIASEDPDFSRRDALNSVLAAFGLEAFDELPLDDASALMWMRQRGLEILFIEDANFDALRQLNHPALLRVGGPDDPRLLALLELGDDRAHLYGLTGDGPLRVPLFELEELWSGEVWVVWNDFEAIRPVLAFGEQGDEVRWLQEALSVLGYLIEEPSGLFDRATQDGLRVFQQRHQLGVDGLAGPRTRMVLYDLLDRYEVPRLSDSAFEEAG